MRHLYSETLGERLLIIYVISSKKFVKKMGTPIRPERFRTFSSIQDRRVERQPKLKLGHLVRTADITKVFSKGDSTSWSYKLYTITEIIHDTIPTYRIDYLPERYNENLLLPTKLSLDENIEVMKKN